MTSTKYIGMDVHKESISIAVMNAVGKVVMESAQTLCIAMSILNCASRFLPNRHFVGSIPTRALPEFSYLEIEKTVRVADDLLVRSGRRCRRRLIVLLPHRGLSLA